ncbi:MAG: prepilin-type N-terminal cleavage/methylation domain-containing protein [Candidatus Berkelbacteria bacterium]|nr:prepilin-type N-terminal cleavage/methylation domain-containing protein [Candidatus Berkelbacteria bacterium]
MSKKITSFTLIELLVVIAIIAVLTGLSLVVMRKSKNVSQIQKIKSDMDKIAVAAEMYRDKYGRYPVVAAPGQPFDHYKEFMSDWPKSPCGENAVYNYEGWLWPDTWDWIPNVRVDLRRGNGYTATGAYSPAVLYRCIQAGQNGKCECSGSADWRGYCSAYEDIENVPKDFSCEDVMNTVKYPDFNCRIGEEPC